MIGNPLCRLADDMSAAGRDLEDLHQPSRDYSEELAGAFREEVPVVTGFLQSTVFADDQGVGVGAVYAGVVARNNPYDERAVSRVDPVETFGAYVDDVLDQHLQSIYV